MRAVALGFFVAFVAWCVWFVPPSMDAFSPFHRLACWYPNAALNTFREGCQLYPLDFGWFRYHRSYAYIGMTPNLMYFPLWSVWKAPGSFYLLGVICLVGFAFGLARALRLPRRFALIPLCYFPIAFLSIQDTGPVRLTLLSIPALVVIAESAMRSQSHTRHAILGAAAGLLVLICVEEKIFYLLVLPSILVTVAACLWHDADEGRPLRESLVRLAPAALWAVAVGGAGLGVLFFVGHEGADSYFSMVRVSGAGFQQPLEFQLSHIAYHSGLWPMFGRRTFAADPLIKFTAPLFVALYLVAAYGAWRARALSARALLLFGAVWAAVAGSFVLARTPTEAHHYVFLHVPILALVMLAARRSTATLNVALLGVVVASTLSVAVLTASPVGPEVARERERIFEYVSRPDIARANILNFSSWGGYYHQSLYGDREQLVTYVDPLTPEGAARLVGLARSISRNIVNICMTCDPESLAKTFGSTSVLAIPLGLQHWHVFKVTVRDE